MKKNFIRKCSIFFSLLFLDALLEQNLQQEILFFSQIQKDKIVDCIRDEFLPLEVQKKLIKENTPDFSKNIVSYFASHTTERKEQDAMCRIWKRRKPKEFARFQALVTQIWKDIACFPVPESQTHKEYTVSYEDSWMEGRTFGGKRGHEGCDIMANKSERNLYPVISMTDGVVEKMGWLTLGGYRIGIRGPSGGYFYYAHLASYADGLKPGKKIKAGELLGFMGDTGYGEEGTIGQFPVHLHVGIYISDEELEECSINPYWILRYAEKKKRLYAF